MLCYPLTNVTQTPTKDYGRLTPIAAEACLRVFSKWSDMCAKLHSSLGQDQKGVHGLLSVCVCVVSSMGKMRDTKMILKVFFPWDDKLRK